MRKVAWWMMIRIKYGSPAYRVLDLLTWLHVGVPEDVCSLFWLSLLGIAMALTVFVVLPVVVLFAFVHVILSYPHFSLAMLAACCLFISLMMISAGLEDSASHKLARAAGVIVDLPPAQLVKVVKKQLCPRVIVEHEEWREP